MNITFYPADTRHRLLQFSFGLCHSMYVVHETSCTWA